MTGLLAAIRPDSWNFPLFLHILGAMVLVGAVTTAVVAQLTPGGPFDSGTLRRFSFRTLLFVAIPAYVVMFGRLPVDVLEGVRATASDDPTWIGIGFMTRRGRWRSCS